MFFNPNIIFAKSAPWVPINMLALEKISICLLKLNFSQLIILIFLNFFFKIEIISISLYSLNF